MPQGPIPVSTGGGGTTPVYGVTAPAVIKAANGRLARIIIIAPGSTSGGWTFNDCATLAAANAANTIWTLAYNGALNVAGQVINLDWPFTTGLVVSAVPGGGSPLMNVSFT